MDVTNFDAMLVDEGQDFDSAMLKILLSVLNPGGDLVIGLDSYQDLYRRRAIKTWKYRKASWQAWNTCVWSILPHPLMRRKR